MANTFASLKKNSSLSKINEQLQKTICGKSGSDDSDSYWKPTLDKAGNGYAVIRYLPAPENEDYPFVKMFDHGFQGPGGWYIENSLSTIGQDDPCGEYNSKLWNSGNEADKEIVRKQKRRTNFHANIYIVKDSGNPSNNGKVFKYKFGKKIMEKLNEAMNPQFEGEVAINPFDFWEGADFALKIRKGDGGFSNYDKSEFMAAAPITDAATGKPMSDEQMEAIWKQQYSLASIVAPDKFKSYDELKAKLYKVLGLAGGITAPAPKANEEMRQSKPKETEAPNSFGGEELEEDDDTMDFFKKLQKMADE